MPLLLAAGVEYEVDLQPEASGVTSFKPGL